LSAAEADQFSVLTTEKKVQSRRYPYTPSVPARAYFFPYIATDQMDKASTSNGNSTIFQTQHHNDGKSHYGGRDIVGYGEKTVYPQWPKGAKVWELKLLIIHFYVPPQI